MSELDLRGPGHGDVLVIDQSYGDQSLRYGLVDENVFEKMLSDAIRENPGARIFFKTHPDNIALRKKAGFNIPKNVRIVDNVNPLALLSHMDKVYVATSQLGFEALMMKKTVKVYGMPFYAGWGLTQDELKNSRRKRKLSLEELFYIFYVIYTKYTISEKPQNACLSDVRALLKIEAPANATLCKYLLF